MAVARAALAAHLARRFVGSLRPGGPPASDDRWAVAQLVPGEVALWRQMTGADRRHAIAVARRTIASLGDAAGREVVAAALLHDVGKIDSGLGPVRRAGATIAGLVAGHEQARRWAAHRGARGRIGRYLVHDEIGARLLVAAGSHAVTSNWAREHHLPPERWTVPSTVGTALAAADDD